MVVAVLAGMAMVVPLLARQGSLAGPKAILTFLVGVILCAGGVFLLVRATRAQARLEAEGWRRPERCRIDTSPFQGEPIAYAAASSGRRRHVEDYRGVDERGDGGSRLRAEVRVAAAALLAAMEEETDDEGLIVCPAPPPRAGCSLRRLRAAAPLGTARARRRRVRVRVSSAAS